MKLRQQNPSKPTLFVCVHNFTFFLVLETARSVVFTAQRGQNSCAAAHARSLEKTLATVYLWRSICLFAPNCFPSLLIHGVLNPSPQVLNLVKVMVKLSEPYKLKNLFRKAHDDNSDPYIALLEFRNAAITSLEYSPSQILMSRRLRTKLPISSSLLKPKVVDVYDDLCALQLQQKLYDDLSSKPCHF